MHACRVPDGTAVPANGWRMTATQRSAGGAQASIDCPGKRDGRARPTQERVTKTERCSGSSSAHRPGTTIAGWKRVDRGRYEDTRCPDPPPFTGGTSVEFGTTEPMERGRFPVMTSAATAARFRCDIGRASTHSGTVVLSSSRCSGATTLATAGSCQQNDSYFGIPQVAVETRRLRACRGSSVRRAPSSTSTDRSKPGLNHLCMDLSDVGSGLFNASRRGGRGSGCDAQPIDDNRAPAGMPFVGAGALQADRESSTYRSIRHA